MPSGILLNTATQRFHPIIFREAPMPAGADDNWSHQRYKSLGHHTVGFDTLEEAQAYIKSDARLFDSGAVWEWDGIDIPAMVSWFQQPRKVA
jgi:hypothetical protein